MRTKRTLWIASSLLLSACSAFSLNAARADEASPVPATVPPAPVAADQTAPNSQAATTPGVSASSDGVAPGPLEPARKMLLARIKQAKSEGIGTGAYLQAFNGIEDNVKAGQTAEQLQPRIESLARALKDQLDRGRILKTQRPLPPTASQSGAPVTASAPKGDAIKAAIDRATGGKGADPATIEKIKERLGTGDIPDGLKDKLMNNPKAREIMQRLGL